MNARYVTYVKKPRWMGVELPSSSVLLGRRCPQNLYVCHLHTLGARLLTEIPGGGVTGSQRVVTAPGARPGLVPARSLAGREEAPRPTGRSTRVPRDPLGRVQVGWDGEALGVPGSGVLGPGHRGRGSVTPWPEEASWRWGRYRSRSSPGRGKGLCGPVFLAFTPKRCSGTPEGALCSVSPESGDRKAMWGSGPRGRVLRRSRVEVTLAAGYQQPAATARHARR